MAEGAKEWVREVLARVSAPRYRHLTAGFCLPGGFSRVYHHHIRKTAGTSLNAAFWALGGEPVPDVVDRLKRSSLGRTVSGGYVFARHHRALIEQGLYAFANSHIPAHEVRLPPRTFTITILRDPVGRLVSHYRYLCWLRAHEPSHPLLRVEGPWAEAGFSAFLERAPRRHVLRQLYTFSPALDPSQAVEGILSCQRVLFSEDFAVGLAGLAEQTGLPLRERRERRYAYDEASKPSEAELGRARAMLEPEYQLLEQVRSGLPASGAGPLTGS